MQHIHCKLTSFTALHFRYHRSENKFCFKFYSIRQKYFLLIFYSHFANNVILFVRISILQKLSVLYCSHYANNFHSYSDFSSLKYNHFILPASLKFLSQDCIKKYFISWFLSSIMRPCDSKNNTINYKAFNNL